MYCSNNFSERIKKKFRRGENLFTTVPLHIHKEFFMARNAIFFLNDLYRSFRKSRNGSLSFLYNLLFFVLFTSLSSAKLLHIVFSNSSFLQSQTNVAHMCAILVVLSRLFSLFAYKKEKIESDFLNDLYRSFRF